jgi:hypothetical protein
MWYNAKRRPTGFRRPDVCGAFQLFILYYYLVIFVGHIVKFSVGGYFLQLRAEIGL